LIALGKGRDQARAAAVEPAQPPLSVSSSTSWGGADNPPAGRTLVEAGDWAALAAGVEEMLRVDDPFVSNRRVATPVVRLGGEYIAAGGHVLVNWTAANRDPLVFGDPTATTTR
jgi:cytochrome P450